MARQTAPAGTRPFLWCIVACAIVAGLVMSGYLAMVLAVVSGGLAAALGAGRGVIIASGVAFALGFGAILLGVLARSLAG